MSDQASVSNTNLDLSKVDNADVDSLASAIETFYKQDSAQKSQLSRNWERNHMMLDGRQWIVYDANGTTGGMWRNVTVSKQNEFIPRPVTNYLFDCYQTLKSYLIKSKPRITVTPNTSNYMDREAAKLATLVSECNWERVREEQNYEYAAATLLTYGTVFKKSYWDTTTVSMVKVPRMITQPQMDPMTGAMTGMEEVQATDPETGDLLFDELPLGDVNTEIVEPYRMALDPLAMDLHKMRWVMEYSIVPISWLEEMYTKEEEGYTNRVAEVKPEKSLSGTMRRFYELKTSAGSRGGNNFGAAAGTGASDQMIDNAAVLKEYYERPSRANPKGRLVAVANGVTLYAGPSPYSGPEQGDWHPYSECRWELVPGRFWGKSPFDDAVEIQKQINSIDSAIILTRKTMAIPQKKIPLGSGVQPGSWTGRPGQEIHYRETPGSAGPETIPGAGVDPSVFAEREQRVNDIKTVTGAIDILKGDRPPGVNAASALNLLYEVGTGKIFPTLDRWKKFIETDQKKQLRMISVHYKEPRPDFVRMLKSKNSELSEEIVNRFIGSDLYDNCNVEVEAGSNVPKLHSAHQAMLLELAQTGALQLDKPENSMEFQRQLGITGFDNEIGPDVKRAEWENSVLDNLKVDPSNRPTVFDCDKDDIHIEIHNRRQKEPNFVMLPIEVQQGYMQHVQAHEEAKMQKMQAQMLQQMAMAPQPGAGPSPQPQPQGAEAAPPPPHQQSGQGAAKTSKGTTKEIKNSVLGADILSPANIGTQK